MAFPTDPIYKFVKDSSDNRNISVMKKNGDHNIYIPITSGSTGNRHYEEYLEWVKAGNTAEAGDPGPSDWDVARAKRDRLLKDSDWAMTTGATIDQAQWSAYREKLRDIPQTYKDKETSEIVWPTIPSSKGPNS